MSIGKVQINNLNLSQGEITAVENHLLFVGSGKGDKVGKLLTVNTDSDLSGKIHQPNTSATTRPTMNGAGPNSSRFARLRAFSWEGALFCLSSIPFAS